MRLPSLNFLLQAFVDACRRFPATMASAAAGVAILMYAIEYDKGEKEWAKVWMMAQLGLALFTGLTAFAESRGWNRMRQVILQLSGVALLVLYYWVLDMNDKSFDRVQLPRYMAFWAAAHLFVAVAPYLNKLSVQDFWEYNKQLFANFIIGAVYSLILFTGLSLAILAVNELFGLGVKEKMYAHLFVLLGGIFNTAFFLFHFPANYSFEEREKSYNAIFKNLCQYILIPIAGLYFLILYAYSIKILFTWSLPHGWVSSLVLGFSVAGIFTYLINYLLPEYTDSKVVHVYRRFFWWVMLPMVGLLFVAIGRRVADYGVTEPRFFVAHAGVWLLLLCAYFLWSKTDNIKFIPISLGLFILVAVIGPFSAFEVSKRSQAARLHRLLKASNRFEGDKLKPGGEPVSTETAEQVYAALYFLEQRDALYLLDPWLPMPWQALPGKDEAYNQADRLTKWLNIESNSPSADSWEQMRSVYPSQPMQGGNIGGYRSFYRVELFKSDQPAKQPPENQSVWLSADNTQLIIKADKSKLPPDTLSLIPLMQQWVAADSSDTYDLHLDKPYVDIPGKKINARLFLQEVRFDRRKLTIENMYGLLFVK